MWVAASQPNTFAPQLSISGTGRIAPALFRFPSIPFARPFGATTRRPRDALVKYHFDGVAPAGGAGGGAPLGSVAAPGAGPPRGGGGPRPTRVGGLDGDYEIQHYSPGLRPWLPAP